MESSEHQDDTYRILLVSIKSHHLLKGLTHLEMVGKRNFVLKRINNIGKKVDESENMIFKQLFSVREAEKLLKAYQCYLSTTIGPIAGLLFISSQKVAFCSDRSNKIPSSNEELVRVQYMGVNEGENMKKPSQKYMEIVTVGDIELWFIGFLNCHKAFKYL
ncbi:GEM-like protein 4 [Gossypium australe]|uniref:GEM-like protein 4 n=1 Tax=Gossypium australe TaxID=47621 RepID=A0A5B6X6F5_9ROSI|nr:GEM-like protein 4 [Gossypium australe]